MSVPRPVTANTFNKTQPVKRELENVRKQATTPLPEQAP